MILIFYIALNLLVLIYFFHFQKKNLHGIEILVNWLVASILFQNYTALFYMNFKYFKIPEILSVEITHLLNRTVLIPVVTLILLNEYLTFRKSIHKFVYIAAIILFLGGIEWLAHMSGVLIHLNWQIGWSILFWLLYGVLTLLFMKIFRKKLSKEVPPS